MILAVHLSYPLAFLAGAVSFLSPCVFPLVPAYVSMLGGRTAQAAASWDGGGAQGPARSHPPIANGIAFVAGFSLVFIAFFYVFRALDITILVRHQQAVSLVAGVIVIVLALQTLGVLRLTFLMRERRFRLPRTGAGVLPSLLLGITFAAGWTPCIGPQLAGILTVASQQEFSGLPLMIVYCLGLGLPFLMVALLTDRLQGPIRAVNRHMHVITLVSGGILLVFGLLLATGKFTFFNRFAAQSPFDL